jgi:DNA-binding MarR family transcriptional regulator
MLRCGILYLVDNNHSYYKHRMSDSIAVLMSDSARLLRRRFDARVRSLGISRARWQTLFAVSRQEGATQTQLADALDVETITVGRMVDRLEEAGLVERRADPADRRAWRLFLTPAAHPLLEQLRPLGVEVTEEALAGLSDAERDTLGGLLERVRGNLSGRGDAGLREPPALRAGER